VVAQYRIHRRAEPAGAKRTHGAREQTGVRRGVEVGAVVERIGVARQLNAVVAVPPAAGTHHAAAQHRQRGRQLVALVVVDQVSALDHGVGCERSDRAGGAGQDARGQRLLGAEGRRERIAQPVQERDPRRRGGIEDMRIGDVGEGGDDALERPGRAELGACQQALAGPRTQGSRAGGIAPGRGDCRPGRAGARSGAAAGGQERAGAQDDGLPAGDHGVPIPAITLSRVTCLATQITATTPASANPARTAAISGPLAASGKTT